LRERAAAVAVIVLGLLALADRIASHGPDRDLGRVPSALTWAGPIAAVAAGVSLILMDRDHRYRWTALAAAAVALVWVVWVKLTWPL
jgi:nicotinamide riboside transporter PnuC